MVSAAKRAGARFEIETLQWLREHGMQAERLAKAGSLDEGDIVFHDGADLSVVLELKVRRDRTTGLSLGTFVNEAVVEAEHYTQARNLRVPAVPAVLVKRVGKPIGEAFVVLQLKDFVTE